MGALRNRGTIRRAILQGADRHTYEQGVTPGKDKLAELHVRVTDQKIGDKTPVWLAVAGEAKVSTYQGVVVLEEVVNGPMRFLNSPT